MHITEDVPSCPLPINHIDVVLYAIDLTERNGEVYPLWETLLHDMSILRTPYSYAFVSYTTLLHGIINS